MPNVIDDPHYVIGYLAGALSHIAMGGCGVSIVSPEDHARQALENMGFDPATGRRKAETVDGAGEGDDE